MNAREAIHAALARSREPDPRVVGRRALARLTSEQRNEALTYGVEQIALEQNRLARSKAVPTSRPAGPSRWQTTLPNRVWVDGARKLLVDCTVADLLMVATEYRQRSEREAALADHYARIADELKRSGCATVGEMHALAERKAAA